MSIFFSSYLCIVPFGGKGTEIRDPLLIDFEFVKIFGKSIDSILKLVLFQDDLSKLPFSVLASILFGVKRFWLKVIKSFMSNGLPKVDILKLFI